MKKSYYIIIILIMMVMAGWTLPVMGQEAGNIITFGSYEQDEQPGSDPIEWQVLAVENGRALLISRYALAVRQYHKSWDKCTWEKSELRK